MTGRQIGNGRAMQRKRRTKQSWNAVLDGAEIAQPHCLQFERDRVRRKEAKLVAELRVRFNSLTPREKEVVHLICKGLRKKQIAENLRITPGTVKVHLMHIFEKTGLKDRLALAVHGRELVGVELTSTDRTGN